MKAIFVLLIFLALKLQGQEFSIFNRHYTKKITKSDILDIYVSKEFPSIKMSNYAKLTGNLISLVNDSFTIDVKNIQIFSNKAIFPTQYGNDWQKEDYKKTFAKGDLAYLKIIKSERKKKTRHALSLTGMLLFLSGSFTAINTLVFAEKGHRKNLLIASGIQSVTGLVLGLSFNDKIYHFKGTQDSWQFGN